MSPEIEKNVGFFTIEKSKVKQTEIPTVKEAKICWGKFRVVSKRPWFKGLRKSRWGVQR